MKKTLFAATVLAASLMAASTVQAAPQEVTMWHYFDQKPEQEMLADMVEEYNSLQDDIHINATFVSRTELMNQYTVGALSGELPDIGQVDSPDMASYVSLGVFEDITDELEAWGELDQFYDGPLSSCKDPDGKVYGLPQNSNCLALACNMDLLKAAGYDHMPESIDEFKEMVAPVISKCDPISPAESLSFFRSSRILRRTGSERALNVSANAMETSFPAV